MAEDYKPVVYVDGLIHKQANYRPSHLDRASREIFCRMFCDDIDYLIETGLRMKLKRKWIKLDPTGLFFHPLYDPKRKQAIKGGAVELPEGKEGVEILARCIKASLEYAEELKKPVPGSLFPPEPLGKRWW